MLCTGALVRYFSKALQPSFSVFKVCLGAKASYSIGVLLDEQRGETLISVFTMATVMST